MTGKKHAGRPTERGEAKRVPLNMRTTPTLRGALAAAAKANGRSLAQEVEFRLEQSLRDDRIERRLILLSRHLGARAA